MSRSQKRVYLNDSRTDINPVAESTFDRFKAAKARSRSRMDRTELTHSEFLTLILDVWEEHEEPRRGKSDG